MFSFLLGQYLGVGLLGQRRLLISCSWNYTLYSAPKIVSIRKCLIAHLDYSFTQCRNPLRAHLRASAWVFPGIGSSLPYRPCYWGIAPFNFCLGEPHRTSLIIQPSPLWQPYRILGLLITFSPSTAPSRFLFFRIIVPVYWPVSPVTCFSDLLCTGHHSLEV